MPWIEENGTRAFVPDPPPAMSETVDGRTSATGLAHHEAERLAALAWWRRTIAEFYEFHSICPRHACRRASRCAAPGAPCHDEALPALQAHVYPAIHAALRDCAGEVPSGDGRP